jgi:hypothetical protein
MELVGHLLRLRVEICHSVVHYQGYLARSLVK